MVQESAGLNLKEESATSSKYVKDFRGRFFSPAQHWHCRAQGLQTRIEAPETYFLKIGTSWLWRAIHWHRKYIITISLVMMELFLGYAQPNLQTFACFVKSVICDGDSIAAWSIPKKCPESSVPLACRFTTGDFISEMFTLYTRCSRCLTYGFFVVLVTGLGLLKSPFTTIIIIIVIISSFYTTVLI